MSEYLDLALDLEQRGFCVIPVAEDGKKRPLSEHPPADCEHPDCVQARKDRKTTWKHYLHDDGDAERVANWYANGRSSIGVATGSATSFGLFGSPCLEMLELEGRAVDAGLLEQLEQRCEDNGIGEVLARLRAGWEDLTPSGGVHWYYAAPGPLGDNGKLAKDEDGLDLIETRAEGQYTILAPTTGRYHKDTGKPWVRVTGGPETMPTLTAEERQRLLAVCRSFDATPAKVPDLSGVTERTRVPDGTGSGWMSAVAEDYNARTRWGEVLAGRFEHRFDSGSTGYWHYIGAANDTSATTNATGKDTLIVFSGTAAGAGFEIYEGRSPTPSYDRFSAHVILTTGRDDKETRRKVAEQLQRDGYGPPAPTRSAPDHSWADGLLDPAPIGPTRRSEPPNLPATFWEARPELAHIRQAAHARSRSADAVLGAVLAHVAVQVPPRLLLPAPVGTPGTLDVAVAIIGRSGSGKSTGRKVGAEVLPILDDAIAQVSMGSGEGIIESYFGEVDEDDGKKKVKVKRQVREAVLVSIDEGQALTEMGSRKGSTLLETIRTLWSGDRAGQANATKERQRQLEPGTYRFAFLCGFQTEHAVALLDDAPGGTPQRFVFFAAEDPAIPDDDLEHPGPLAWNRPAIGPRQMGLDPDVHKEVSLRGKRAARAEIEVPALDSHRDLSRLKVAGLLAILAGRYDIDGEDWSLAGQVLDASDRVRDSILDAARHRHQETERATTAKLAHRAAVLDVDHERRALERGAATIGRHVHKMGCDGGCKKACAARSMSKKQRDAASADDALAEAIAQGWVVINDGVMVPGAIEPPAATS